jgi:uncharacterized protein (DUF1501 family)
MTTSRRQFLRGAALLTAASTLPTRWLGSAQAATLDGYAGSRAAVCVFLLGGCDTNNVLVPRLGNPYAQYLAVRPTLGLTQDELLRISPAGLPAESYGLHPSLTRVREHFTQGRAAFVCNVGPLVLPTNRQDYTNALVPLPDSLFSHSDQQDAWAGALANPSTSPLPADLKVTGWGGRTADQLHGLNANSQNYPEVTLFGGKPRFGVGSTRQSMVVAADGTLAFKTTADTGFDTLRADTLRQVMGLQDNNLLETAYAGVFGTAQTFAADRMAARDAAWNALAPATRDGIDQAFTVGADPSWTLTLQLYQVVKDLVAGALERSRGGLGLKRQLFSVGFGSFDTHQNQRATHEDLFTQLDFSLDAFQKSLALLEQEPLFGALPPQATLFTMSDFSRTLVENSDGGTDHGWGGHALVLGNQVLGGRLYGTFPNLDVASSANTDTTDSKGRWIPTLSVEQYGFTLASWLGLSTATERDFVFPNLSAYVNAAVSRGFPAQAQRYKLSFMKTS